MALFERSADGLVEGLRARKAATMAADNGAIAVWIDDSGRYRGEAMRYKVTLSSCAVRSQSALRVWLRQWIKEIR